MQENLAAGAATATATSTGTPQEPLPVTAGEYRAVAALLALFVVNILLALLIAGPADEAQLEAFEDPDDVANSAWYIVLILAFTALILWIARKGKKWLIRTIILAAVGSTLLYVFYPLLAFLADWTPEAAFVASVVLALAATAALYWHPEWYVLDIVGVLVAAGASAIFGISLTVLPVIVLLVALAIYDAIAVYKTKHMLTLADSVIELRLPVLLVIPKGRHYSFLDEAVKVKDASAATKGEREAMFMGLGDLVMPTILVISAFHFPGDGWGTGPALGAAVGTLVGYGVLMGYVLKGNPQAGLPLLNGGSIVGFLTGLYLATGSLRFW